jgi:uncharacterized membrane protein
MRTVEDAAGAPAGREHKHIRETAVARMSVLTWLALGAIGFGIVLRLVRYFADRSLWLDESLLSINLMTRSYRDLLETLDYNQGSPIGFLWVERFVLDLFGDSELALRLFPLVAALASLGLFYLVSRLILDQVGTLVGTILFATMEPFVRYSAEVKQYGLDVAVSLALVYLFVVLLEPGRLSTTGAILLAGAGPGAVCFSHPSVFLLAGVAVAGLYLAMRMGNMNVLMRQLAA